MPVFFPGFWVDSQGNTFTPEALLDFLSQQKTGIFLLDGPSSCGKSRILRSLRLRRDVTTFTCEQICDEAIRSLLHAGGVAAACARLFDVPDILALEDLDFLRHKHYTQEFIGDAIYLAGAVRPVIITAIDGESSLPTLLYALPNARKFHFRKPER